MVAEDVVDLDAEEVVELGLLFALEDGEARVEAEAVAGDRVVVGEANVEALEASAVPQGEA